MNDGYGCETCKDVGFVNYGLVDGMCSECADRRKCRACHSDVMPSSMADSVTHVGCANWKCPACGFIDGDKTYIRSDECSITGCTADTRNNDEVLDCLRNAWNKFVALEQSHPDDIPDFRRAIHECQRIMATRQMRRLYPHTWPTME